MPFTNDDKTSLERLAQGAAIERFNDELQRTLNNIVDPNTADGVREINLKVRIKPDENRKTAEVSVSCSSKLQHARGVKTRFYIGKDRGLGVAFEHNPNQMQLELDKNTPKPVLIDGGKKGA